MIDTAISLTLSRSPEVAVAPGERALGGVAHHRGRARRDDHRGIRQTPGDSTIDWLAVVGAVRQDRVDQAHDLVEQRTERRDVSLLVARQR